MPGKCSAAWRSTSRNIRTSCFCTSRSSTAPEAQLPSAIIAKDKRTAFMLCAAARGVPVLYQAWVKECMGQARWLEPTSKRHVRYPERMELRQRGLLAGGWCEGALQSVTHSMGWWIQLVVDSVIVVCVVQYFIRDSSRAGLQCATDSIANVSGDAGVRAFMAGTKDFVDQMGDLLGHSGAIVMDEVESEVTLKVRWSRG